MFFLLYPGHALGSEQEWNYSVGISLKQLSLDVYRLGKTDPEGTLTEGFAIIPVLGIDSKINYFSESSWGYKWVINFGGFEMTTQDVNYQDVNLGTSSSGYYLYAMPVGVYNFHKGKENNTILLGLGVGVGYLRATGNIIFTEATPQLNHEFDLSQFTYSFGLFFEQEFEDWSYGVSIYGPEVPKGDYEYNIFDLGFVVRKRINF